MLKNYLWFVVISVCCQCELCCEPRETATAAITSGFHVQDISSVLQPIIDKYGIPGMVAAVVTDQGVVAAGATGVRARHSPNKILIGDSFHIGSDTKSMTATMIAMLVERKLLRWDSRVIEVFPELKDKVDPAYKDLTLELLLTHRGGVPADLDYDKIQDKANGDLVHARQAAMEQVLLKPPEVALGNFLYSNMGYVIAGHMAEKVTGQSWENLMRVMLFSPLKMSTAGFGPPGTLKRLDQPMGHDEKGNPSEADNPLMIGPAGTVHLSIFDWAKYAAFHLNGARGKPYLLQLSSFQKLHHPISQPPRAYAMGWIVDESEWAQGKVLVHAGSNTYWYAKIWIAPERNLAILVACNDGSKQAQIACNEAALLLMQSQLNLPDVKSIDPK